MAEYADPFNASLRGVRVEDQGSVSGSEDDAASYFAYQDPNKMDADDGKLLSLFSTSCISLNQLQTMQTAP
jgi:hypothetical protein